MYEAPKIRELGSLKDLTERDKTLFDTPDGVFLVVPVVGLRIALTSP